MALLTNPNAGDGKLAKFLLTNKKLICAVLYLTGIIWFLSLAHRSFNNATYFSENALLPGLVQGGFDEDIAAKKFHTELREIILSNPNAIPRDWLISKFNEINLDAYEHNFTLIYPLANNTIYRGQNVYAILRAPRSSGTEGLIVTAPFRSLASPDLDSSPSIALLLALAKYCRRHKYWAKDIIFLVTEHEQLGTQAWLQAYHNVDMGSGILHYGDINVRAGSLQAAINLEIHSIKISHVDVKVEGLNGQLPNLDLVNLVHKLCKNEGIQHTFKNRSNPRKRDSLLQQWFHSLKTLLSMVLTQASCVPNGNHGLYHRFGIEAVTLEGFEPQPHSRRQISGLYQTGRVLEGILRSLNNLLERFHQSYFFYLLPSNDRFIPIGSYMPSVSLIGAPLLIKGLTVWLNLYNHFKPKASFRSEEKCRKSEAQDRHRSQSDRKGAKKEIKLMPLGISVLISHIFGWLFVYTTLEMSSVGSQIFGLSAKNSIYAGFSLLFAFTLNVPYFFKFSQIQKNLLSMYILMEMATVLLIIAMHNFSLSIILSAVYVPWACFVSGKLGWTSKIVCSFFLLLVHPFVFTHLVVLLYTCATQGESYLITKAFSATQHSFVYLITDDMIYGNWLMKAVFGFFVPLWILLWLHLIS